MQKQEKIVLMFDKIASTYDRANTIMSMGIDKSWRKKACDKSFNLYKKTDIDTIVDVACGTGDMMDFWQKRAKFNNCKISKIIGIDPSKGMLNEAKKKFPNFLYHTSKATQIPLDKNEVDFLSISYGIRNVVELEDALVEFNRVLKKDGLIVVLEFMKNEKVSILGYIRDFYMNKILPKIGGFISKNTAAYEYLPNSIDGFLTIKDFSKKLENAGFEMLYVESFSMDISTLLIARKK